MHSSKVNPAHQGKQRFQPKNNRCFKVLEA
jgi:hypothetical protein